MYEDNITEADVKKWIKESGIRFLVFDRSGIYIHRYKKIGCYERFFVNFNVASAKLLVYTADERKTKKQILFVATNKEELQKKSLYEIYIIICPYTKGIIRNIGRRKR